MATCVVVDAITNALIATSTAVDSCTTYVVMDASTYHSQPTLAEVFAMPVAGDMQSMWMLGFGLPVICYLVSWAYQTVIAMFNDWAER